MYRSSFPSAPPQRPSSTATTSTLEKKVLDDGTMDRERRKSGFRSSIEEDSADTIRRTPGGPGSILWVDWSSTNNPTNRLIIRDVFITLRTRRRTNWRTGQSKGTRHAPATNESDCSRWIELLMNYISLLSPSSPPPSGRSTPALPQISRPTIDRYPSLSGITLLFSPPSRLRLHHVFYFPSTLYLKTKVVDSPI